MLKFISLGSGSSGNCYYFAQDDDAMLIDAGVGIRNIKKFLHDKGVSIDSVKRILITHDHADHIKSVGVISSEYDIPVYATAMCMLVFCVITVFQRRFLETISKLSKRMYVSSLETFTLHHLLFLMTVVAM